MTFQDSESGYTVTFKVEPDIFDSPEEWLGEWTDDPHADGAIRNPAVTFYLDEWGTYKPASRDGMPYFIPAYSYADRRRDYHRRGYARHIADCMARADCERDAHFAAHFESYMVICNVSWNGTLLGSASSGSVTFDAHESYSKVWGYLRDVANDIAPDAIAEAQDAMEEIADAWNDRASA
jgi:hypothetical protein